MTSLYLIRHAQAEGNVENRFQGRVDRPLTDKGRQQVKQLALRMRAIPINVIYTSPLRRAWDTALGVAAGHSLVPITSNGIAEIDGGDMEDRTFDELRQLYPEESRLFMEEPHKFMGVTGGESIPDVFARMRDNVLDLVDQHAGQSIAVVSHGCALRCFLCYALGLPLERMNEIPWGDNTSVSHLTFNHRLQPLVHSVFDASHLMADRVLAQPETHSLKQGEPIV